MTHWQQPGTGAATPWTAVPAYAPHPPKDLTGFAVAAFATAAASTLFNVGTAIIAGRVLRAYEDDPLDWSLVVYGVGSVLELVTLLAGWVAGSLWLRRARANAELIDPAYHHARSAGWAWGGWICPIVSFWFPFQLVRDVLRAASPGASTTLLGWWWGLFLAMSVLGNVLGRWVGDSGTGAESANGVQTLSVIVAALTVGALVLWGAVLRQVTRVQHARMRGEPA